MATITAAAGGGNWTVGGTWVGGVAPTAADDAVLDASSGAVTVAAGAVCRSLDCTGYTGTLTHTPAVTFVIGDGTAGAGGIALKLVAGMTYTAISATCVLEFASTAASQQTIATAGKTTGHINFTAAGSWILQSAVTSQGTITLSAGTLDTNGQAVAALRLTTTGSPTLTLGASVITMNSTAAGTLTVTSGTTLSGAAAEIVVGVVSASSRSFAGGGKTYGKLTYTVAGSAGALSLTGANTFGTIAFSDVTNARTLTLPASTVTTVTTSVAINGTSGKLMTINSSGAGTQASLSKLPSVVNNDYLSVQDIRATGGAYWYAGANSVNVSGNTGWHFGAYQAAYQSAAFFAVAF